MTTSTESTAATLQKFFQAIDKTGKVRIRLLLPKDLDPHTAYDLGKKCKQGNFNQLGYKKDGKPFKSIQQGILDLSDFSYQALKHDGSPQGRKVVNGISELQNLNNLGFGIYFLANVGTGFNSADMTEGLCLFHESDKASIDEQQLEIDRISQELGKPSAVIETGKSLHTYYRLTEPLDRDSWPNHQRRWLQYSRCDDPSLSNINRLMRVPGFNHVRWDQAQQKFLFKLCQIHQISPDISYGFEQFDRVLPELDLNHWAVSVEQSNGNGFDMRSMAEYLEGYNPNGRKGWATAKCPVHGGESLDSLHINQETGAFMPQCGCDCQDVFRETKILALGAGYKPEITATTPPETADEDETNDGQNLKRLLASDDYDLLSAIAEPLRGMIKKESKRWSLPPLVYISVLLPIVLSLSKVDTVLNAKETKGKPILWTCLVGSSNSGKSESSGSMIAPLEALQDDATDDFELKLAEFKHDKKSFDEASRVTASKRTEQQLATITKFADVEPVEPACKEYYLSDYTQEVVGKVLKPQKDSGLLIYMDELKPFFCFDRYTNGSGNRARTLQWYDSKGIKINRKGDDRIHISKTAISLVGTTQHSTLESLIKEDPNMEDGLWARLCLIHVPTTPTYSHEPEADNPIDSHLKRVYGDLRNNPATTFTLSLDAKTIWANWYNETVDSAIRQNCEFLASIYGKAKDRAARVALALHLLNAAINRKVPELEISAETLQHAIAINRLMLHDTEKLLGLVGATTEIDEARIIKFVTKFQGKESVNTTGVKSWWPTKSKPSRQQIRDFMKSIVDLGFAKPNEHDHTSPKYEILIMNPSEASSIRPKPPKAQPENDSSIVHKIRPPSSSVVHVPVLDEELHKADGQPSKMDDGGRSEDEIVDDSKNVDTKELQTFWTNGRRYRDIKNEESPPEEQPNHIPLGELEDDY
jgi:hypothetical protein